MRVRRGFTLIETGAVIFVIALLATSVAVSLHHADSGRRERTFEAEVVRLSQEARLRAIASGRPVELAFEESARRFELRETGAEGDSRITLSAVMPDGLSANRFELDGESASSGVWTLRHYPDGTCDDGGIEFSGARGSEVSIVFDRRSGSAKSIDGALPDRSGERWAAGELERRGGP